MFKCFYGIYDVTTSIITKNPFFVFWIRNVALKWAKSKRCFKVLYDDSMPLFHKNLQNEKRNQFVLFYFIYTHICIHILYLYFRSRREQYCLQLRMMAWNRKENYKLYIFISLTLCINMKAHAKDISGWGPMSPSLIAVGSHPARGFQIFSVMKISSLLMRWRYFYTHVLARVWNACSNNFFGVIK